MLERLKKFAWGYVILALVIIGVGVCFIAFSDMLAALAIAVGVTLAVFGIIFGVLTLARKDRSIVFAFRIAFAIMALISGIVTAIVRDAAVGVIADVFCLLLIVDGSFKLRTAVMSKRYSLFGWWVMLVLSTLTIGSAFTVAKLMSSTAEDTVLTVIIGIIMIVDGVANFFTPFYDAMIESKEADDAAGTPDTDGTADDNTDSTPTPSPAPTYPPVTPSGRGFGGMGSTDSKPDSAPDSPFTPYRAPSSPYGAPGATPKPKNTDSGDVDELPDF